MHHLTVLFGNSLRPGYTFGHACEGDAMYVLLVEDSAAQRLVLLRLLEQIGHKVVAVGNAEQALALKSPFDVLITDITLPGMTGEALIGAMRGRYGSNLRIVAVSASQRNLAGADAILTKPVTKARLACAIIGGPPVPVVTGKMRIDRRHLAGLERDLGHARVRGMLCRFIAETDTVCARPEPDSMALHHLAGAAALFGAVALHTAALAGDVATEWPETRAALLATFA